MPVEYLRRPGPDPDFERVAAAGLKYTRFHTTALCSPTRAALLARPQPPHRRHGRHHRDRHERARLQLLAPQQLRAAPRDVEAQRLQHRPVRQVPRGARLGGERDRPVRPLAASPAAGSSTSTASSAGRPTSGTPRSTRTPSPVEPWGTPEDGYHFMGDMTDKAIAWTRQQKSLAPDKPFFTYFAPGRHARAAPRPQRTGPTSTPASSTRAGTRSARRRSRGRRSSESSRQDAVLTERSAGIPAWDEMSETIKPALARADGGVRRLPGLLRPPRRAPARRPGRARGPRRHPDLPDHRRQRGECRGLHARHHERGLHDQPPQRHRGRGLRRGAHRRHRHALLVQPLRGRLGARDGHALPVDEAGRQPLGRHAQRHDRELAERHRGARRDPQPVRARHRRRARRCCRQPGFPNP